MCGIAGFIDYQKIVGQDALTQITEVLHHRGPDDTGYHFQEKSTYHLGLGHKRLSIIDISSCGHQPMHFDTLSMVYNGEVYNYTAIREKLITKGYHFQSSSDTEVILKSFHCWGMAALSEFIGMFAIALFNRATDELFLIRDRIGVKPLYYHEHQRCYVFGSELKSIIAFPDSEKKIDREALTMYLYHGYITGPSSIFYNVFKVLPGTYIRIKSGESRAVTYWSLKEKFASQRKTLITQEAPALEQLDTLVTSSVQYRMVADVPIGAFLSGGYDSSLVVAMMQKLSKNPVNTFTIGFREAAYNEADHARAIADHLQTNHYEKYFHVDEALGFIEKLPHYFDEPLADSSQLPTMMVSALAREHVTVALSGDGGDELFCGYTRYDEAAHYWRYRKVLKLTSQLCNTALGKKLLDSLDVKYKKLLHLDSLPNVVNHRYVLSQYYLKGLVKETGFSISPAYTHMLRLSEQVQEAFMLQDMLTYLPDDILTKVDRSTMSVSLEGRDPLLDHRLFEYSFGIAHELKYRKGEKKYLLKKLTHRYVPERLLNRPKKGFSLPVHLWLKKELRFLIDTYLSEGFIASQNIFDYNQVRLILCAFEHERGNGKFATLVWNLIVFQLWYQKYCIYL